MDLQDYFDVMLPAVEEELRRQISRLETTRAQGTHEMITYHMGWQEPAAGGKRIRPFLLLLISASVGGCWNRSLPAAAAVEMIHNFSLIHDDIQDNSPTRRGRAALWKVYGMPMAINAGDAMFTMGHQAVLDLSETFAPRVVLKISEILQGACLDLTLGQHLDLAFQRKIGLSIEDYWSMIEGKTGALISAAAEMGALLAEGNEELLDGYRRFGRLLGLAFQVQDDVLGIWGDEAITGKSAASDLVDGKNSLPVLYGISQDRRFAARWTSAAVRADEVTEIADMLRDMGAYDFAVAEARRLTDQALATLRDLKPAGEAGVALFDLAQQLLSRTA